MRKFLASFFGTLAAITVVVGGAVVAVGILVTGARIQQPTGPSVEKGSWLVLDLSDNLQDTPVREDGFEQLARALEDDDRRVLQTRQAARALEAAATDDDIAGLYLSGQEPSMGGGSGLAALAEVRRAISAFRAAGKPVRAYLTYAGLREYYLASAASDVVLDPFGAILLPGLAAQPVFFAGTFEKFGIGVQVTRVGRFKSAVEPYIRRDMSPESRAQTRKLLDDLWDNLKSEIAASRGVDVGVVQQAADREALLRPEFARSQGLVDRVAYLDQVLDELRESTDTRSSKQSFRQVALADYARLVPSDNLAARRSGPDTPKASGHEKIAIVYAEGAIVDGTGTDGEVVWSAKVARDLREIRRDASVKAVVLRVNSPGGSVSASEAIQREVRRIRETRPVVVSMGSLAASGGYWISTYSDRIFAEPSTITGSIGVFGLLFNVEDLATRKLGLSFDTVKTARFADAGSMTRPQTDEELALVQRQVDWIYEQFLAKVAESRNLDVATVEAMAEGRVWSGAEARRIGLVDELGGLDAAVKYAVSKVPVGEEFTVVEYPRRRQLVESIVEAIGKGRREKALERGPLGALVGVAADALAELQRFNDPRGLYARLPFDLSLR